MPFLSFFSYFCFSFFKSSSNIFCNHSENIQTLILCFIQPLHPVPFATLEICNRQIFCFFVGAFLLLLILFVLLQNTSSSSCPFLRHPGTAGINAVQSRKIMNFSALGHPYLNGNKQQQTNKQEQSQKGNLRCTVIFWCTAYRATQ